MKRYEVTGIAKLKNDTTIKKIIEAPTRIHVRTEFYNQTLDEKLIKITNIKEIK